MLRLALVPDVVVPPVALGGAAHQPGELVPGQLLALSVTTTAANYPSVLTITEKAPTRAFSWLKAPTSYAKHYIYIYLYAKQALTHG